MFDQQNPHRDNFVDRCFCNSLIFKVKEQIIHHPMKTVIGYGYQDFGRRG